MKFLVIFGYLIAAICAGPILDGLFGGLAGGLNSALGSVGNAVDKVGSTLSGALNKLNPAAESKNDSPTSTGGSTVVSKTDSQVAPAEPHPIDINASFKQYYDAFYNFILLISSVLAQISKECTGVHGSVDVAIVNFGTVKLNAAKYIATITTETVNNVPENIRTAINNITSNGNDVIKSIEAAIDGDTSDRDKRGLQLISQAITNITKSFNLQAQEVSNASVSKSFDEKIVISRFLDSLTDALKSL